MARRKKLFKFAILAAIAGWLVKKKVKPGSKEPEGVWQDAGPSDGWDASGKS